MLDNIQQNFENQLVAIILVPINFVNARGGIIACFEKSVFILWRYLLLPILALTLLGGVTLVKFTIEYEVLPKTVNLLISTFSFISTRTINQVV